MARIAVDSTSKAASSGWPHLRRRRRFAVPSFGRLVTSSAVAAARAAPGETRPCNRPAWWRSAPSAVSSTCWRCWAPEPALDEGCDLGQSGRMQLPVDPARYAAYLSITAVLVVTPDLRLRRRRHRPADAGARLSPRLPELHRP